LRVEGGAWARGSLCGNFVCDFCLIGALQVDAEALAMGSLYPPLSRLRDVSVAIAVKVCVTPVAPPPPTLHGE